MSAAVALAIMLAVVVAGLGAAMQSQRPLGQSSAAQRPVGGGPTPIRRPRQRKQSSPKEPRVEPAKATKLQRDVPEHDPVADAEALARDIEARGSALRQTGLAAEATVVSVVDERVVGPVTRSRLTLRVLPTGAEPFEVQTRVAFPTPEARARVRVGALIPVRYDPDDHQRVLVELPEP